MDFLTFLRAAQLQVVLHIRINIEVLYYTQSKDTTKDIENNRKREERHRPGNTHFKQE